MSMIHDTNPPDGDPALAPFLAFLARDMAEHPGRLHAVDASLAQRIQALTGGVEVDLDAPLSADD
jgi:antitoxin PrlF